MGRPNRKRPRPLLPATSQKHVVMKHPPNVPAMFKGTGLRSLLIASASNTDVVPCSNTSAGNRETTQASRRETEAPAVQHVWGAVSEGDIAHDGSGLRLGVDVDVDRFGVVWLLNPGSNRTLPDLGNKNCLARGTNSPESGSGEDTANETGAATKDADIAPGGSSSVPKPPPLLTQLSAGHLEKNTPAVFSDGAAGDEEQALRDELSTLKGEFGDIPTTVFKRARSACNPAEAIGSGPFLNRSAAKLANIDAMAGLLMLSGHPRSSGLSGSGSSCSPRRTSSATLLADWRTQPARQRPVATSAGFNGGDGGVGRLACRTHDGREFFRGEAHKGRVEERQRVGPKEGDEADTQEKPFPLLLFADLCGGPGGFSEYILRRRRQLGLPAKGWGISLREGHFKERDELHSGDAVGDDPDEQGGNREVCEAKQGGRAGLSEDPENDDDRRVRYRDPCAWRVDRLTPWCDISVTRGGDSVELVHDAERGAATANTSRVRDAEGRSMTTDKDSPQKEDSKAVVVDGVVSKARSCFLSTAANREPGNDPHPRGTSSGDGDCCQHDAASAQGRGTTSNTVDLDTGDASPPVAPPSAASLAPACPAAAAADDAQLLLEMRIDYGADGTGNLADENNIRGFVDAVLASTGGRRLDLVVSDGGFGAARNARDQERLVSPLVHCEALTALLLLAEGGAFLCKLFEVWTERTASLVYLLHRKFRRIAIIKPITSRPASGERYLVCTGLLPRPPACRFTRYLRAQVHELLQGAAPHSAADQSLGALSAVAGGGVSHSAGGTGAGLGGSDALNVAAEMKRDGRFLAYLRLVNDRLAKVQINACARIIEVCSSERGRAWVFRGGQGARGATRHGVDKGVHGEEEKEEEEADVDAAALKLFMDAWCLGGLGAVGSDNES